MGKLIRGILRFIRAIFIGFFLMILLIAGMAAGGFFLLDYLVSGEEIEVPNLYLKTKEEAIVSLAENGLMLKTPIEEFPSKEIASSLVIEQRPSPHTRVKKGRRISITISTGAEQVNVPELIGRQEQEIHAELRTSGLELGAKSTVFNKVFPENTVIAQDPMPGLRLVQGNKVNILVSLGPRLSAYVMPDFTGESLSNVLQIIDQYPFEISENDITYQKMADVSKWNRVLEQKPASGEKIVEGEQIHLVVGSSGHDISPMHMIHVNFPLPDYIYSNPPSLIVWDDIASVFGQPAVIPVNYSPFMEEIDTWIPVFGEALVLLGVYEEQGPLAMPEILHSEFFSIKGI